MSTSNKVSSQIAVSPSVGCVPGITNANFSYLGPPASSLTWNFGDGSPTTNLVAPQHSYLGQGSYVVVCTAIINGSPQVFNFTVTVHPSPSGNFSYLIPPGGCAPRTASFTATGTGPNLNFTWSFGDNTLGSGSITTHAYVSQGSFVPVLTVQNTVTGCFVNVNATGTIQVSSLPNLIISTNPAVTSTCTAPFTVAFSASNSTSGSPIAGGGLSYNWTFGNSQTASAVTPGNITYNTSGVYNVVLTSTDNNNCTHSVSTQVSVVTPSVNFIIPPAVCINTQIIVTPIEFTVNVSASQNSVMFDMGDGSPPKPFPNPLSPSPNNVMTPNVPLTYTLHQYSTPGIKTISCTVTSGNCMAVQTKTIMVENITPAFSAVQPSFTCNSSLTASLINQSTVNTNSTLNYAWLIDHWNGLGPNAYTSTLTNPSFTLTQGSLNPYTIYQAYYPPIILRVNSSLGCVTTISQPFYLIQRPSADYFITSSEGCAPLTVTLVSSSTSFSADPVTNYTWCSGTVPPTYSIGVLGPLPNAGIPDFIFTYTATGTYSPYLTIQTVNGCTATSHMATVTVVNPPDISMTFTPASPICASQGLTVNLSSAANPQHWHVTSDAGFFSGCVNNTNPVWNFTNPGVHGFTVNAYLNSCVATSVMPQTIQVKGPVVKLRYETDCMNKLSVKFNYELKDVLNAKLDFGESASSTVSLVGSANNTVTGSSTFVYLAPGDYTATLTGSNTANGCLQPMSHTLLVTVRQPSADFTFVPVVCKGVIAIFSVIPNVNNQVGCSVGYTWYYNNQPPVQMSGTVLTLAPSLTGIQTLTLRVKDVNGCTDTKVHQFRVAEPNPTIGFNHNPICYSDYPLILLNLTPQTPDPVTNFIWYYGGYPNTPFPQTSFSVNGLTQQTFVTVPIGNITTFSIALRAFDSNGCVATNTQVVQVNNPQAFFNFIPSGCMPPTPTRTFNCIPGYASYSVNFGNGSPPANSISNIITTSYPLPGVYTPTLTVTDAQGCKDDYTQTFSLQTYPVANYTFFNISSTNTLSSINATAHCMPANLSFSSTSTFATPVYYIWDLGNGPASPPNLNTTAGTSYTAGTYTVNLTLITSAGCVNSKTLQINIYDKPFAEILIDKNPFCLGDPIVVTIKNRAAVDHWQWDFGDSQPTSTLSSPSQTSISYPYNYYPASTNGTVQIILTAYSPGNVCKYIETVDVKVIKVTADFKRNNELSPSDYAHCLGAADTFSNTSSSNSNGLNYTWNFGDGGMSISQNPGYTYQSPGVFTVQLKAQDTEAGCINTASKTMTVYALPSASLSIDNLACPDSLFHIYGAGLPALPVSVTGTLMNGQNSYSVNFSPANTFTFITSSPITTIYSLQVMDNHGCKNSPVTDTIHIQTPPPSINTTTTVIVGQTVSVNGFVGNNYTYSWTPITTSLSCTNCYNPISGTTVNITYSLAVGDLPLGCFEVVNRHTVIVELVASLDVPTAFTPNNDGVNDIISPGGWGIRKLIYFKVFNRWGQLLFESNDISIGWDGNFNGVPQNMETYIYQASVDTYTDETLTKTGSFKLIR